MKREEEKKQLKNLKERYKKQNEYLKDKYDRVSAVLPKGTKERLQAVSDKTGIKASAFITKAVLDAIEREERTAAGTPEDAANDPEQIERPE